MAISDAARLLFEIRSDSSQVQSDIKKLRSTATSEFKGIETSGTSAFAKLGSSIGLSTGQVAGLGKALPIAGAALTAVVGVITTTIGVVVALGTALFGLVKLSSEFGSAIYDGSVKSGLLVETVSALVPAAKQGGSSVECLTKLTTKFSASLADASQGNKQLIKDLERFGIDAKTAYLDPDKALRQFITSFNQLPESAAKNRAEMRLFKDRTGELLPVLDQVGGSFEDYMEKMKRLGVVMDAEGARKADEFSDQLTELGLVADAVGRNFAGRFTEDMTNSMADIQEALISSQESFKWWGDQTGDIIRGVFAEWRAFKLAIAKGTPRDFIADIASFRAVIDAQDKERADSRTLSGATRGLRPTLRGQRSAADDDGEEAEKRAKGLRLLRPSFQPHDCKSSRTTMSSRSF